MIERRSLLQQQRRLGDYLKLGWIFNTWYEKAILSIMFWLGGWKILGFFGVKIFGY